MRSHLNEAREMMAEVEAAWARGVGAALCEVVTVTGSAYRRPGALMMMAADGVMHGTVSGGCLEGDIFVRSEDLMATGGADLIDYDLDEDDMWSLGLGCKGRIKVWVRALTPDSPETAFIRAALVEGGVIVTRIPDGMPQGWTPAEGEPQGPQRELIQAVWNGAEPILRDGLYVRAWRPPHRLIIAGAGHDAEPVAQLAREADFEVAVLDARPAFNDEKRFPGVEHWIMEPEELTLGAHPEAEGAFWVVMNHHKERDRRTLEVIARLRPQWVGALGPWQRTAEITEAMDPAFRSAVHGPLGLDIGADTPQEVAISIVGELMAASRRRSGGSLNRKESLHG
ncbi:MAG: XdhC family protein [Clostridia bacterium]